MFGVFREASEKGPDYSPVPIEKVEIDELKLKKSTSLVNRIKIGAGPGGCEIYRGRE